MMKEPSQKKKKKKVVVRHLPPSLSQSDLVSQIDLRFADRYNWFSFRPGKSSHKCQKYSRAYLGFEVPEDVYEFAAFFNGHVFVNEKGAQYKAIVEYAPSQRVPKQCEKKDPREASISKDPDYLEFRKLIAQPVENLPSAEIQLERREAAQSGTSKTTTTVVTPLMDFIRQKRATVMGSPDLSDVRRGGRKARAASANKPSSRPAKRNSDKKKYVEKDSLKILSRKDTAEISSSKHDSHQSNSAPVIDSSLPGIALTMDSGKKKILLLKSKAGENDDNPPPQPEQQMKNNLSGSSLASSQNQKSNVGGRFIKGILLKSDSRLIQTSTFVQPEQREENPDAENCKRPPRPANNRAGNDYHPSGTINDNQERRTRNKDRTDRAMWAPLRHADLSHISEDQPLSSKENNGEMKHRMFSQRYGEVMNSSGGHSHENGSARHSNRRVGGRNRKEDVITGEGKSSRRGGGGGPNAHEKQKQSLWIQKSSSGT